MQADESRIRLVWDQQGSGRRNRDTVTQRKAQVRSAGQVQVVQVQVQGTMSGTGRRQERLMQVVELGGPCRGNSHAKIDRPPLLTLHLCT